MGKIFKPVRVLSVEFSMVAVNACFFLLLKSVKYLFDLGIQTFSPKCKSVTMVNITIFYSALLNIQLVCLFLFFS